jgi:hypothetical protein
LRYGVIDLETYGVGGEIALTGVYDGREFRAFESLRAAVDHIENSPWCKIWYAHYGGGYDYRYFLDDRNIFSRIDRGSLLFISGRLVAFATKAGAKFRDSFALLPAALAKLARDFGCRQKGEYDDYEKHEDKAKLLEYLKGDCLTLHEVIGALTNELPVAPRVTLAGTAMAAWRGMNPKDWRWLRTHNLTRAAREFLRQGYYGGRVEVFEQYGEGLCYYDVNSMYPAVMLEPVPWGFWNWVDNARSRMAFDNALPGIYCADVEIPVGMAIPPLPVRRGNKLYFPVGRVTGCWPLPELQYSASCGCNIRKIRRGLVFKESRRIFTDYVQRFWRMKNEGEGAKRTVAKLLLNSLYGKFGMRNEFQAIIGPREANARMKGGEPIEVFDRALGLYIAKDYASRAFIRPEIAAYVTARARIKLHKMMAELEAYGDRVFYCDTDSVITDSLMDTEGSELGEWVREKIIRRAAFIAPKSYALDLGGGETEIALKGIPAEVASGLTFADAEALVKGERGEMTFTAKRLVGLGEAARRLDVRTAPHRYRALINRERKVKVNTDKRRKARGFKTRPRRLRDWS